MEIKHLQSFFKNAGTECCYAAALIKLACKISGTEHNLTNIGGALDIGIDRGYIYFNPHDYLDPKNFLVVEPSKFLTALTGKKFKHTHESAFYKIQKNEYEILFFALNQENANMGIGHFILDDYDPYQNSNTVSKGQIYSKRVFRCQ